MPVRWRHSAFVIHGVISAIDPMSMHRPPNVSSISRFVAGIPAPKRLIEETFGGRCMDMGSMAEMTPWMTNAECRHRTGMHLWQDLVYTQVCAPDTFAP